MTEQQECPMCAGTGHAGFSGYCRQCRGTGRVSGRQAVGATMAAMGSGLIQVFWSVVILAVLILVIVAAIQS